MRRRDRHFAALCFAMLASMDMNPSCSWGATRVRPVEEPVRLDPVGEPGEEYYAQQSVIVVASSGQLGAFWRAPRRDGSGEWGIRGRWFSPSLEPLSIDFLVNSSEYIPDSLALDPFVAAPTEAGAIVVGWTERNGEVASSDMFDIRARLLLPTGPVSDSDFQVNPEARGLQSQGSALALLNGRWLAAWQDLRLDPFEESVRLRFYQGELSLGDEFRLLAPDAMSARDLEFASGATTDHYAVWVEQVAANSTRIVGMGPSVAADAPKVTLVPAEGLQSRPSATKLADGRLLVGWRRDSQSTETGLFTAVYDRELRESSAETLVWQDLNPLELRDKKPRLVASPDGTCAVLLFEDGARGGDHPDRDVLGLLLESTGRPLGEPFRLSGETDLVDEFAAALVWTSDRQFLVAWSANANPNSVIDWHVHARRFDVGALTSLCGDVNDDGFVMATDALASLRAAVGATSCSPCLCDVNNSGSATSMDALAILRSSVAIASGLVCPACEG